MHPQACVAQPILPFMSSATMSTPVSKLFTILGDEPHGVPLTRRTRRSIMPNALGQRKRPNGPAMHLSNCQRSIRRAINGPTLRICAGLDSDLILAVLRISVATAWSLRRTRAPVAGWHTYAFVRGHMGEHGSVALKDWCIHRGQLRTRLGSGGTPLC